MVDLDLCYTSTLELRSLIQARELSPVELMSNTLERIDAVNEAVNCFCFVYHEEAMEEARRAERVMGSGASVGPLHGIPVGIKDVTPTAGKRTTRGSKMYEHWIPDEDSILVQRLTAAGAIVVGKTTTPEFAHAGTTSSPLWGITRNPWNLNCTPGGSSGGSGAAVAAGCLSMAEGTDMGGSVRIPAAYCGLVGLKPSLGRIPMDILPSVFDNISHFGPLTRTVADANLFMNVTGGPYERDIMSNPQSVTFPIPADRQVEGTKVALCPDLGFYSLHPEVESHVRSVAAELAAHGAEVQEVNLPWSRETSDLWSDNWGVYLAVLFDAEDISEWRDRLDPGVVALIERGRSLSAFDLKRIEIVRTRMWHDLCEIFEDHDVLLSATCALPAYACDGPPPIEDVGDDGKFRGLDLTSQFNFLAQCPAVSVPCGFATGDLPVGVQIIGHRFDDLSVMRVAGAIEAFRPWAHRRPPLKTR